MRLRQTLRHPLTQAFLLLALAYVLIVYGIRYLPPLFGVASAPVPKSIIIQFMAFALAGVMVYVSDDEERWRRFREPILATMVDADKKVLRTSLLVLIPLAVAWLAYAQAKPSVGAAAVLRSIHPAPPGQITFRGKTMQITGLENPLRAEGSMADHLAMGRRVYYQNCLPCHGDLLDGQGHFAHGFNPVPLSFTDNGTIAQLTESFVFWRIAKGGPGLPREGTPWNSAMPVWEDYLTEEEIWSVIIFLYQQTGWEPRRWEVRAEGGSHE